MFVRPLLKSSFLMKKPISTFFKSRSYLTGDKLKAFRDQWYKLPELERKQIASVQDYPTCGDILISKGDFFMETNQLFQARACYNKAAKMNKECENLSSSKIAILDKIEKKLELDKSSSAMENNTRNIPESSTHDETLEIHNGLVREDYPAQTISNETDKPARRAFSFNR